jgi:glycosyltransferase involved in cell wall biosynthesis
MALSEGYANMDLLVFPSHTDTFGNVVLEALASGVPAIVTPDGGPKYIVRDGQTGIIADDAGFASAVAGLLRAPEQLARMRVAAREYALTCSWDAVFDRVYDAYGEVLDDLRGQRLRSGEGVFSSPA